MKTAIAGYVLLAVAIGVFISRCGTHWTWGRLGMPEPILDRSGVAVNGVPDPLNHVLIRTGHYQEVMWGMILTLTGMFAWLVISIFRADRQSRKDLARLDAWWAEVRKTWAETGRLPEGGPCRTTTTTRAGADPAGTEGVAPMSVMAHWREPYRVAARGWLSVLRFEWVAVPSLQAPSFHHSHPLSDNALSYARLSRAIVARRPQYADRGERSVAEVRALEQKWPHCVVFVLARVKRNPRRRA